MGYVKSMTLYQNIIGKSKTAEKCLLQPRYIVHRNQNFYQAMWVHREHSHKVSLKSTQVSRRSFTNTQTDTDKHWQFIIRIIAAKKIVLCYGQKSAAQYSSNTLVEEEWTIAGHLVISH